MRTSDMEAEIRCRMIPKEIAANEKRMIEFSEQITKLVRLRKMLGKRNDELQNMLEADKVVTESTK